MPGPPPKRSEERRRRNKPVVDVVKVDLEAMQGEITIPAPPVDKETGELLWHDIAILWYTSLGKSGQAIFYEPSDWAMAYLIAEQIDRELKPQPLVIGGENPRIEFHEMPMNGSKLAAILKAASSLLAAEGDRRRLSIELERAKARAAAISGDNKVVPIAQQRAAKFRK